MSAKLGGAGFAWAPRPEIIYKNVHPLCLFTGTYLCQSLYLSRNCHWWSMVSNVKFYYPVGSQVQYECLPGLTLDGAPMLECLENAIWSSSVPLCTNPLKTN